MFTSFLVFLRLFVFELEVRTRQADRRTGKTHNAAGLRPIIGPPNNKSIRIQYDDYDDDQGRRPRQKSRGDNKMMYCTSTYAVHKYQTSKAPPTFSKPVLWPQELGSRECCKFSCQLVLAKPGR